MDINSLNIIVKSSPCNKSLLIFNQGHFIDFMTWVLFINKLKNYVEYLMGQISSLSFSTERTSILARVKMSFVLPAIYKRFGRTQYRIN